MLAAVGGRPHVPDGLEGSELAMTSDEVLDAPPPGARPSWSAGRLSGSSLARSHAFGSATTLMLRGEYPLRGFDQELRECLTAELEHGGLAIRCGIVPLAIRQGGQRLPSRPAAGRCGGQGDPRHRAQTGAQHGGPGVEAHGVKRDPMGPSASTGSTSQHAGIFAVGDASNHAAASLDGEGFDLTLSPSPRAGALAEGLFNDNLVEVG